jgi:hypothetical protein
MCLLVMAWWKRGGTESTRGKERDDSAPRHYNDAACWLPVVFIERGQSLVGGPDAGDAYHSLPQISPTEIRMEEPGQFR